MEMLITEQKVRSPRSRGRVLIVEDEALIAIMLEDLIADFGYEVAGSAASVDAALALIGARAPDIVLLDLFLHQHVTFDLADQLLERRIPYVLMTGSAAEQIPPRHKGVPQLNKPFADHELEKALRASTERLDG